MIKIISVFNILFLLLISCASDNTTGSTTPTIKVNTRPFSIVEKNGNPVELTINNQDSSKTLVGETEWMSSDDSIATVTAGVVRFAATPSPTSVIITATIGKYSTNKKVSIDSATVDSSGNLTITNGSKKILIISSSTTTIADNAFESRGLTSVIIPDSVETIGSSAFNLNPSLTNVTLSAALYTNLGSDARRARFGGQVNNWYKPDGSPQSSH